MGLGLSVINHDRKQWIKKNRWFISTHSPGGNFQGGTAQLQVDYQFRSLCNLIGRPRISFEKVEIRTLHETVPMHGRPTWEPIEVVFFHVGGDDAVYKWLQAHYNPQSDAWGYRDEVVTNFEITLVNGIGQTIERWIIEEAYASLIDWGELDQGNTDFAFIAVTLDYARARNELPTEVPSGGIAGPSDFSIR